MFGKLAEQMVRHALDEAPRESVGAVVGGKYVRLENVAQKPEETFEVASKTMAGLVKKKLRALVHSHPGGLRHPTLLDMRQQVAMGVPWGIVVLRQGHRPEVFWWGGEPEPLVGRAFRHGVHDCWSAVRDWYWVERKIRLPDFPREYAWWEKGKTMFTAANLKKARAVEAEGPLQAGDVLLMAPGGGSPNHAAVYVGNGLIFHHLRDRLSRHEPLHPWERYVVGHAWRRAE